MIIEKSNILLPDTLHPRATLWSSVLSPKPPATLTHMPRDGTTTSSHTAMTQLSKELHIQDLYLIHVSDIIVTLTGRPNIVMIIKSLNINVT